MLIVPQGSDKREDRSEVRGDPATIPADLGIGALAQSKAMTKFIGLTTVSGNRTGSD